MKEPFLHRVSSYDELWKEVDFHDFAVPDEFNMGVACLDDQGPEATALVIVARDESSTSYTFGDVKARADRLANGLASLGIRRGDVVAVVNPASLETAVAYMAI